MSAKNDQIRSGIGAVLQGLRRNKSGNTLAMVAAGLVPMTAMIGSGVDISRSYMVQSRLQQACDAAVLAGRRAMDDGLYDQRAQDIAESYFNFNFPLGFFGTENRTFVTTNASGTTTVNGTATATVPTVVMSLFNFDEIDTSVECTAQLEIANTDVTFVLDTTGSMVCPEDTNTQECRAYFTANGPVEGVAFNGFSQTSRLQALKDAIDTFYTTLDDAAANSGARIRYGFVPYSQTVNTGYLLPPSFIANSHTYQSLGFGSATRFRAFQEVTHDTSTYKTGVPVRDPTGRTSSDHVWQGCIEERGTVAASNITYDPSSNSFNPTGLHDLDIDSAPISDETRWKPYWPEIVFLRNYRTAASSSASFPQTACPARAALLNEYDSLSDLQSYHATLQGNGGTYHDLGLQWGARISSPQGIFSTNVNEAPSNGSFVGRHMIWMSDGVLEPSDNAYSANGIERHDPKITGVVNGQGAGAYNTIHRANRTTRFKEMCKAIKAKGIRLWVVAFNTDLSTDLSDCASSNSSFVATGAADLKTRFEEIAEQVAELRLTE